MKFFLMFKDTMVSKLDVEAKKTNFFMTSTSGFIAAQSAPGGHFVFFLVNFLVFFLNRFHQHFVTFILCLTATSEAFSFLSYRQNSVTQVNLTFTPHFQRSLRLC